MDTQDYMVTSETQKNGEARQKQSFRMHSNLSCQQLKIDC